MFFYGKLSWPVPDFMHSVCGWLPEYLESLTVSLHFKIWEATQILVLLIVSSSRFNDV
jgi:hypothetical protein